MTYVFSGEPRFVSLTPQGEYAHWGTANAAAVKKGKKVDLANRLVCGPAGQASNTVCALVPSGMAPAVQRKLVCRYTGGTGILTVETTGEVKFNTALTSGQEIFLDDTSYYISTT